MDYVSAVAKIATMVILAILAVVLGFMFISVVLWGVALLLAAMFIGHCFGAPFKVRYTDKVTNEEVVKTYRFFREV
jgi:uncharacterized membrane protein